MTSIESYVSYLAVNVIWIAVCCYRVRGYGSKGGE